MDINNIKINGKLIFPNADANWKAIAVKNGNRTFYLHKTDVFRALASYNPLTWLPAIWNSFCTFREQDPEFLRSLGAKRVVARPQATGAGAAASSTPSRMSETAARVAVAAASANILTPCFTSERMLSSKEDNKETVAILNDRGYILDGKYVSVPQAEQAKHVEAVPFQSSVGRLPSISFYPMGTRNAIIEAAQKAAEGQKASPIALNFANENHACGGPGFYWSKEEECYVYERERARAQEEALTAASNFADSVMPWTHPHKSPGDIMTRSYFNADHRIPGFISQREALLSQNHLFMDDDGRLLKNPQPFTMLTSAAPDHGDVSSWSELSRGEEDRILKDVEARIRAHLCVAAAKVKEQTERHIFSPVILGAFGCGAFSPRDNSHNGQYSKAIAGIYKKLLGSLEFRGAFQDGVIFAVPGSDAGARTNHNYREFRDQFR